LPLLERKRLYAAKADIEERAKRLNSLKRYADDDDDDENADPVVKRVKTEHDHDGKTNRVTRPWKEVYAERCKVERNWRHGRCTKLIFDGHLDGVTCLQFNETILATGSYDTTIKIWNVETAELIRTLTGHQRGVRTIKFDDEKLISGSMDGVIKVWNYHTGECISNLRSHSRAVVCVDFDDEYLVSGSADRTIRVCHWKKKFSFSLTGHTDWVNDVYLHSASGTIFSASDDATVRMWDLATKKCVRVFKSEDGHVGQVQTIVPLTDYDATPCDDDDDSADVGKAATAPPAHVLTGSLDNTIKVWNVATGECVRTLFGHVEGVWALGADKIRAVSGAHDRLVKIWDLQSGRCERTFSDHLAPVSCIHLTDSRIASGSDDGRVIVYSFNMKE